MSIKSSFSHIMILDTLINKTTLIMVAFKIDFSTNLAFFWSTFKSFNGSAVKLYHVCKRKEPPQ